MFSMLYTSPRRLERPTYRLGVKFPISTGIRRSPCDLSKRNNIKDFELPFYSITRLVPSHYP